MLHGLRHFDSPGNPCASNLFPCFSSERRDILCHENASSLVSVHVDLIQMTQLLYLMTQLLYSNLESND